MSEPAGNVFEILTGDAFTGDGEGAPIPGAVEPDALSIQIAEHVLREVRAGRMIGLQCFAWNPAANGFDFYAAMPPDEILSSSALRYLGFLETVKENLLDLGDCDDFARDILSFAGKLADEYEEPPTG